MKTSNPSFETVTSGSFEAPLARSLVNESVALAKRVFKELGIFLPPFAFWPPSTWDAAGVETREIQDCMLGWDVTDFGSGRFQEIGRTLFTLRNGRSKDPRYPKPYAEKLLLEPAGQRSPLHYHISKREDIINRGGGSVIVILRPVDSDGSPGDGTMEAQVDGTTRRIRSGEEIRLRIGESITIPPLTYHQFWGEENSGILIDDCRYSVSSEVSSICDDWSDNVFVNSWAKRFPVIKEDAVRTCYLCHEYPSINQEIL